MPGMVGTCLWRALTLVSCFMLIGAAHAGEPLPIADILAEPSVYHLRQVTIQGTVRNVQPMDPYQLPSGTNCYGAYRFMLEDETTAIAVAVQGLCGIPTVKDPDVDDGDRVTVDAIIQAPSHGGYNLDLRGFIITAEREGHVQAVANRITPLAE